ncbi:MAG: hypothetical protein U0230_04275 [Polyangiales bacterium]
MEGREPAAIAIVLEDLIVASREAEVVAWMRARAGAAVSPGHASAVVAFVAPWAKGGLSHPRFLTVFEAVDTMAAAAALARLDDHDALGRLGSGVFAPLSGLPRALPGRTTRGLLVGLTDCPDPARLPEFHRWYDEHHAADVLRSGKYFAGRRYHRVAGDLPEFAALYETEGSEPDTFRSYLEWPERDRTMTDACAVRHVFTYERLFSHPTVL